MSSKLYFDEVATKWDTMRSEFFPEAVREKIYTEMGDTQQNVIVDLGAGSGFLSEGIIDRDNSIIAIDQSPKMITLLQSKFADYKNIRFLNKDAEQLGLDNNSVDFVIANMFLHHVERPAIVIKEIYRILSKNGRLIFTDLDTHNHEFLISEQYDRWMGFERDDISSWMSQAGFTNIKLDCVNANCCASSCTSDDSAAISIFIASGTK